MPAILYMMLVAVLTAGFFAGTTMNGQIARNQKQLELGQAAADGGMQFIRYQLGQITVPAGLTDSGLLSAVASQLGVQLNGTANMNGHTVAATNGTIFIPAQDDYVTIDSSLGIRFQAAITASGAFLNVKLSGYGPQATVGRGIQMRYQTAPRAGAILNYGVASAGPISMSGNVKIQGTNNPARGSVLSETASANPLTITGNGLVSGDFSYTNGAAAPSYGSGTIAGYSSNSPQFAQHIHAGVPAPPLPTIDTSVYAQYATNPCPTNTSGATLTNCVIPANTNPSFSGGTTIQGVLYICTPNSVTFSGGCTIQGCIVVENNPQGTSNSMTFSGNVQASSISTLPNNSTFPAGERALTGAFILAPSFAVTFSGNFGTIGGTMVADSFNFSGNAGGTIQGSVIGLQDKPMVLSGNSDIIIGSTGTSNYPTGMSFGDYYTPLPGTYVEISP